LAYPVTIEFEVDELGQLHNAVVAKDDDASASAQKAALETIKYFHLLPKPPQALRLTANLCNDATKLLVSVRDVDYSSYMCDVEGQIKKHWTEVQDASNKVTYKVKVSFHIHQGGELSDLKLEQSAGASASPPQPSGVIALTDSSCLKAVQDASPFRFLPDGFPRMIDIKFTFSNLP
jgi:hypothetical protein